MTSWCNDTHLANFESVKLLAFAEDIQARHRVITVFLQNYFYSVIYHSRNQYKRRENPDGNTSLLQ